jgi:hypothetical protein
LRSTTAPIKRAAIRSRTPSSSPTLRELSQRQDARRADGRGLAAQGLRHLRLPSRSQSPVVPGQQLTVRNGRRKLLHIFCYPIR